MVFEAQNLRLRPSNQGLSWDRGEGGRILSGRIWQGTKNFGSICGVWEEGLGTRASLLLGSVSPSRPSPSGLLRYTTPVPAAATTFRR